MIEKMTKYSFILLSSGTEVFLEKLKELHVMDITRSPKPMDEHSAALLAEAEAISKEIKWLESGNFKQDPEYASICEQISRMESEVVKRQPWGDFSATDIEGLSRAGLRIHFYSCPAKRFDPSWAEICPLQVISENDGNVYFVTVTSPDGPSALPLTELPAPDGTADEAKGSLLEAREALATREAELFKRKELIPDMQRAYNAKLSELETYLASKGRKHEADGYLSVMTGFAPTEDDAAIKETLDAMDGVYYLSQNADVEDNPPIKLRNNRFVRMFEVLTDMYGRPAYNGFDPTPYISIFFLLFFAMCMGDAGYGILLAIVGLFLKKVPSFKSLAPLVVTLGIGTIVVGFFFHTFFSMDISTWECIPDALKKCMVPSKISTYDGTMILALVIGIIHLCLAMIVKTIYATKNQGFLGSLGIWGWTLLIVGGFAVAAAALAGVIDSSVTKIIVIALGVVSALGIFLFNDINRNPLKNIGSGLWEAYNTATGLLGDVLSYLRLYALGLAGSMLGFAFNDLAKMTLGDGGIGWIPFIAIVIIGHTLNLAMAVLGAFVHPLRLNFLEFFKNSGYEGVGRNYKPIK